ncbi:hypothetical protein UlMin_013442 [Ulmus minor]
MDFIKAVSSPLSSPLTPPAATSSDSSYPTTQFILTICILVWMLLLLLASTYISVRQVVLNLQVSPREQPLELAGTEIRSKPKEFYIDSSNIIGYGVAKIKGSVPEEVTCCSICLEDFEESDECRVLVKCKHTFHLSCIDLWLARDMYCPLCRGFIPSVRMGDTNLV